MTTAKLSELVRLRRGASYKSQLLGKDGIALLGLGTIRKHGGFKGDKLRFYSGEAPERMLLKAGDLYVSLKDMTQEAALLGAVARVPPTIETARLTQDTIALDLIAPERVNKSYLYWQLQTPRYRSYCRSHGTGTTNLDLSQESFLAYEVPVPDLEVQHRLVAVLGALDDKIAANRRVVAALDQLGRTLVERDSAGGTVSTIDDVAELVTRGVAPKYSEDGYLVLNQKCVRNGRVDSSLGRTMATLPRAEDKVLRRGDILVNSTGQGTLGRVGRWTRTDRAVSVDSHVTIVRIDRDVADPDFVGCMLLNREADIEALAEGTTGQTELRRDAIAALPVRLPAIEDQRRVGEILRAMSSLMDSKDEENRRLAATRDELLPLLMSGKITVKDAERHLETNVEQAV